MADLRECRIDNIAGLAQRSISQTVRPWVPNDAAGLAYTVCHRLAHLISRLETFQYQTTAIGAKWYLENVDDVPVGDHRSVVQPFIDRLQASLTEYEERHGRISSIRLGRLVELSNYSKKQILAGQDTSGFTYSLSPSPSHELSGLISSFMWRQSVFD